MATTSATKKKNSPGKNGTRKTGTKNGSGATKNKNASYRRPVICTALLIAGLFDILVFIPGADGSMWYKLHCFYFAVFGLAGCLLPVYLLFLGVTMFLKKGSRRIYAKAVQIFMLTVIFGSILHVNIADPGVSYFAGIRNAYENATGSTITALDRMTGVLSAVVGGIFLKLGNSRILGNIFCILLLFVDLILIFGITPEYLYEKVLGAEKRIAERRESKENIPEEEPESTGILVSETEKDSPGPSVFNKLKTHISDTKKGKAEKPDETESIEVKFTPIDYVNDFYKDTQPRPEEKSNEIVFSDEPNMFTDDVVTVMNNDTQPPDEKTAEKAEKVSPLSKEETEKINAELDAAVAQPVEKPYIMPPIECLNLPKRNRITNNEYELKNNGEKLIAALNSFNVQATILDVIPGPTVTRYELSPAPGIKISRFVGLSDDLALHLAAPSGLRIEAPIPNKAAIGVEIPNKNRTTVTFREIVDTPEFRNAKSKLNVGLGKDIAGSAICSDLAKMPHLLVAGTTGSGKSVCLNTMIVSLLYNAKPSEVKMLLIDPKQVEFSVYNGIPHLLVPVVSDPRKAAGALGWAVTEMLNRYKTLNACGVRDIGAYNMLCDEKEDLQKMPQIVIFIDELSDLMTVAQSEVEDSIQRLAQMARAAGMHLVVATQRPSVDVITGVIKANIPSRIALSVTSQVDSRTIIDSAGAEKLMGYGDMLYYPVGVPKPIRVQGSFLSDTEIETVVKFIKAQSVSNYDSAVQEEIERQAAAEKKKGSTLSADASDGFEGSDDLLKRAVELFIGTPEKASISALQRHLGLGFAKAGRLMDTLEEKGFVGPHEGSKPRKVLITKSQWYEMNNAGQQAPEAQQTDVGADEEPDNADDFIPFTED